ncbi:hypothetical protein GCM10009530_73650 [Microbispora corallina]|uniref:Uncharacterized protein n=1 Tax=Microbispora corallina TaxID=83302 RepID=A0ABQ4GAW5_9ACTN|nr:hypothetical protein Mco01_72340 [Microbispora corallina]
MSESQRDSIYIDFSGKPVGRGIGRLVSALDVMIDVTRSDYPWGEGFPGCSRDVVKRAPVSGWRRTTERRPVPHGWTR